MVKYSSPGLSLIHIYLFKQLKKDVRAIASQQIDRLEQAMCQRRRWTAEQVRLFLVEHPLVDVYKRQQLNFVTNIVAMVIDNGQMPVIRIITFDLSLIHISMCIRDRSRSSSRFSSSPW